MRLKQFYTIGRTPMLFIMLAVVLFSLFSSEICAHSPVLIIEDNENGTSSLIVGFSDGERAAGMPIFLKSQANNETLWDGRLNQSVELLCPKYAEPYFIFFNGTDFDETINRLLPNVPLTLRQENGVLRATEILQGYQYHHQSGLLAFWALVDEKKQAGKRVEMAINPIGLCFGVTTGYLALEYAIKELYGADVPAFNDLKITTKTKMGGVWDTLDICFGTRLTRQDAEFGMVPNAFLFTAERLSTGQRIVFAYKE